MSIPAAKMTMQQFAALARGEQLAVLRRAPARRKLHLLLDAADGEELLALLPPQDLFLLARELGPDQIPELLGMATPEQWTAFFDFDCWDGDHFDSRTARTWLAVLLDGEENQIVATVLGLNFELLVLMLHREIKVISGPEDIENEIERGEMLRREGGYVLEYRDEEGAKLYGALLDVLFRHHAEFFFYLLEAIRAEDESLLEESVYQQRAERLIDQGFADPQAAPAVYAWLDPEQFMAGRERKVPLGGSASGAVPGAILQLAPPGGLLAAVLADGGDAELAWELACLANKALMAERVDFGDLDQAGAVVAQTFVTLNLALEYLAGNDLEQARCCLREDYVERLFRLGFSLTLRLRQRARALRQAAIAPYLDRRFREVLDPLLQPRPQFAEAAAQPEHGGARPFASLREVRLVEDWLDRLEIQRHLFESHFPFPLPAPAEWDLTGCHPERGADLTLSTIFLTALANRLLGRAFAPQPLATAEVVALHALVTRNGRLDPELRRQTLVWLDSLESGADAFGAFCLERWDEEFCAVTAAALDPRYVGGLIVSTS